MKKVLSVVLIALLALSFVTCGSGSSSGSAASGEGTTVQKEYRFVMIPILAQAWFDIVYNAAAEMERALHIAAPYGFIQLFINESKEILPLLWMIHRKTDIEPQQAQFIDTLTQRISGFD